MQITKASKHIVVKSVISFIVIFGAFHTFNASGWYFAYEQQPYLRCLPYELSLIKQHTFQVDDISRGGLVAVKTDKYAKYYQKDIKLLKAVVGLPGDVIDMTNNKLAINNIVFGTLMRDETFQPFTETKFTLKKDEFFVVGTSKTALDSRIIGPISSSDIIGYGYAIL
jgi:signal peptidase I|tara:strand:+ start:6817 stop:7320 length:504 start_codon:yes stop_codon:yes gene_type:complete